MNNGPRPRTRPVTALVMGGLVLLAAACGSSPSSSGSPSSASSSSSASSPSSASSSSSASQPSPAGTGGASSSTFVADELAFARCVRSHGVPDFPDPDGSGHFSKQQLQQLGISPTRLRAAQAPCQNLLPAGPAPLTAQEQQDYLRAAACMRSHGITSFPDPVFSGGGVTYPIPSSIDAKSTRFAQARQTCVRFIPAGLPYNNTGSGG